jgi:hypothetical protein
MSTSLPAVRIRSTLSGPRTGPGRAHLDGGGPGDRVDRDRPGRPDQARGVRPQAAAIQLAVIQVPLTAVERPRFWAAAEIRPVYG